MPRTFLDWTRHALPAAAEVLVEAHLPPAREGDPESGPRRVADLSAATVVVPGGRAGRRLVEVLLKEAERRGAAFLPPRLVTVGALPALLHTPRHPPAPPAVRRLVWAQALHAAERGDVQRLFARLPDPDETAAAWRGLAREVAELAREVGAGGLTFDDVARRCSDTTLYFDDSRRWHLLARLQSEVEHRLDAVALCDPELERIRALERGEVSLPGAVWLVGVAELPGVVAEMLRRAAVDPGAPLLRALVHAPSDRADDFDDMGLLRPEVWLAAEPPLRGADISVVAGPGEQADAVARLLARRARSRRADEVVVGVPDPEVVPALAQRLGRHGVRVREAAGTPMRNSGPWRLLAALAEVLRDRRREAVAALVRHPDLGPWLRDRVGESPDTCLAALDRWSARHLPARMVAPYPGVERSGAVGDDARLVRSLMGSLDGELLAGLGAAAPLGRHMPAVETVLSRVYSLHRLEAATPTADGIRQALRALERTTETLRTLPAELDVRCDGAAALGIVLDEAAVGRLTERPDPGAVELLGWLEVHLDDAPITVVTGVNEGSLPETLRGDPFLPDGLRRHLGLEDNRRRLARDLYRLTAMLHSREVLHLVAGRRTGEGDPLRPSRLLFAADDATVARRVRRFYGVDDGDSPPSPTDAGDTAGEPGIDGAGAPGPSSPAEPATAGHRTPSFALPPEPALEIAPFPETLSPTDFRAILADPYRWALTRLRGPNGPGWPRLEPVDDDAAELDGAAFGDLAHLVLERFGQEELRRHREGRITTDPGPLGRRLAELLDEAVRARFGTAPKVAVHLQVEQLRLRLTAFAEWHAAWVEKGWRMEAAEVTTPAEGVPLGSTPQVGIRGKIDRIDRHPEHGWAILDYKTGDRGDDPTATHIVGRERGIRGAETEWRDLQLPLYHWLAPRLEGLGVSGAPSARIDVGYVVLPRDADATDVALAGWDPGTLAAGVDTARRLVSELASGPVRYDQDRRLRYDDDPRLAALLGRTVLGGDE